MAKSGKSKGDDPSVEIRCLCGKTHRLFRRRVVVGLGMNRRKCRSCGRRFVINCTPDDDGHPESFWPIFLEEIPSRGDTQKLGFATDAMPFAVPEQLCFRCRCGYELVSVSRMYGRRSKCPKCESRIVVRVGYESEQGNPIPLIDYPDDTRPTKGV